MYLLVCHRRALEATMVAGARCGTVCAVGAVLRIWLCGAAADCVGFSRRHKFGEAPPLECTIRRGTTSRVQVVFVWSLAWHGIVGKGSGQRSWHSNVRALFVPHGWLVWKARSACVSVAGRWGGSCFRDCFSGYCRDLGGERSWQSRRKFGEHCNVFRSLRQLQTPL